MKQMNLAERLVKIREDHGYTRKRLCEELGRPYATVTKYETGEREPGHSYIIEIAQKFGVTTDYILGIEKKSPPEAIKSVSEKLSTEEILLKFARVTGMIESDEDLDQDDLNMLRSIKSILEIWFREKKKKSS